MLTLEQNFTFVIIFVRMKKLFLSGLLFVSTLVQAQVSSIKHTVSKGETITQIAKHYNVTVQSILVINPGSAEGIREYQVLLIPKSSELEHEVQAKETIYGISKQYNIATEKLYELNPGLKENGLKIGQILVLSAPKKSLEASSKESKTSEKFSTYEVLPGDTIYSIAVRNGVAVSELYESNPGLETSGLKKGQTIKIPKKDILAYQETRNLKNKTFTTQDFVEIKVAPKQTLYNIQKTYGVSDVQLNEWNPSLADGLKEGMIIKLIPNSIANQTGSNPNNEVRTEKNKPKFDGFSSEGSKEMVLLMPFDLDKNDPKNSSIHQTLTNDVFLNMTLDFYSGAKIAVEKLQSKDIPLTVRVVDSKESNRSMDVNALKTKFDFSTTDVIIGPFYQKNVDELSKSFKSTSTLIVSPLSTDKGQPYPNQVHTMPNEDLLKSEVISYLESKNENVVSITHPSDKNVNAKYYNGKSFITNIETNAKGNVTKAMLEGKLKKGQKNYVILDTSNLTATIESIFTLNGLMKTYDIQLVVLDRDVNLDSTDVSIQDLANLNMLFPSVTNESNSSKRNQFTSDYKKKYGKNPSKFAVRGYDVVTDMAQRMFSGADGNLFEYGTDQVENKFTYIDNDGGIYNNGVFILHYSKDLTIKEAK